ncbi:MAG TPA: hypothetical protein VF503_01340 [Sphingobium sp.]|uniref:hypothetical protein n=1 Tax=Sphingobium sp. TaxID=1912891 RepID=UPI002ED0ECFC
MIDAVEAISAAAYVALSAPDAMSVSIFTHPPQDTPAPLGIIGNVEDVVPIGRAGDPDRRGTVEILFITEGEEREPCTALMGECNAALNDRTIAIDGWNVAFYFSTSSAQLDESGLGYLGGIKFAAIALSAG